MNNDVNVGFTALRKNLENHGKGRKIKKNQGKPEKLRELYLKIRGTRENSEFYFEIRFIFMLYIFSACPYVIIDLLLFSYLKI